MWLNEVHALMVNDAGIALIIYKVRGEAIIFCAFIIVYSKTPGKMLIILNKSKLIPQSSRRKANPISSLDRPGVSFSSPFCMSTLTPHFHHHLRKLPTCKKSVFGTTRNNALRLLKPTSGALPPWG